MKYLIIILSVLTITVNAQWIKTGGPIGGLGYNIRIDKNNKNIMYVTDAWSGVNKSTDGGQTWFAANNGITSRTGPSDDAIPVFSLTIDHNNSNVLWVGTQGQRGVFKSTDAGNSFTRMETGIIENEGLTIRNFEIDPNNSDIIFLSAELSVGVLGNEFDRVKGVLYKTTNGGNFWTKALEDSSLFRWMCINPSNSNNMITFSGIFDREALNTTGIGALKSTDGGVNWTKINNGINGSLFIGGMAMNPASVPTILIGTGNNEQNKTGNSIFGGVFLTTNTGSSWAEVLGPQNPTSPGDPDNIFTATAYSQSNPSIVYAANAQAFYRSENGGIAGSWIKHEGQSGLPYGPPGVRAGVPIEITVDKDDPNAVFVNNYGGGVFKSTDGAQTWSVLGTGYTGADIHKVAVFDGNSQTILANGRSGPFKSTNGGTSWNGVAFGNANYPEWYSAVYNPSDSSIIFLTDEHQGVILKSIDGGNNWTLVFRHPSAEASNVNTRFGAKEIIIAKSNPQIMYAGFTSQGFYGDPENDVFPNNYGVYKSTDGGDSWFAANNGLENTNLNILSIKVSSTNENMLYVGTRGSGIFKSTDGAGTWTNITSTIPDNFIHALDISKSNSNIVFAATKSKGVFKSTDGGTSWVQVLDESTGNSNYSSKLLMDIAVDPSNPDDVVIADFHSGIYRTTDGGSTWSLFNNGLSTRAVGTLSFSSDGSFVYAGTKGEGVFRYQFSATGVANELHIQPDKYVLGDAYPNPFNPSAIITYSIPEESSVNLTIYDLLGKEIRVLVNTKNNRGTFKVSWDGTNNIGQKVASGTYLYRIKAGDFSQTKKIVLMK